jgi:putative colanic acid biosynthesis UDP-glucose lipid carrier transferase
MSLPYADLPAIPMPPPAPSITHAASTAPDPATDIASAPRETHVRMFAAPSGRRLFGRAPQSVSGFVAAVLEPGISALVLVAAHLAYEEPFTRASMTLMLLMLTLTFPGRDRFRDRLLPAAVDIMLSWLGLMALLLLCGYATHSLALFEWPVLLAWAAATPLVQWAAMMVGRDVLRWRARQESAVRRAIIVGAGGLAVRASRALGSRVDARTDVLGFFDDRSAARLDPEAAPQRLGGLDGVAGHVQRHGVHDVYITLPMGSQPRIVRLLESLQGTTASIWLVPDVFGISVIQGRLHDLNGLPVVGLCETPFTGMNDAVKRVSDVVLASLILLLIAPLLAIIALGIKLTSPGPVIFRQRRNGLGGEEIVVYKFRSMRTLDDGSVVRQASKGDARITPFGAFLRKTSLDELPQFINVLQGRMSIVGPRPHAVAHNETYRELIKAYMVRHKVRPGITGWAQVNGHRGETDTLDKMRARVEYDLEYLRNWSLRLDLQIIARTIKLVIADRNAY